MKTTKYWDNPFDTRKIGITYKIARDARGMVELDPMEGYYSTGYGIYRSGTRAKPIAVRTGATYTAWDVAGTIASGYIGAYVSLMDEEAT